MDSKQRSEVKSGLKIDAGPACSCCPPWISLPSGTKGELPNPPETDWIVPDRCPCSHCVAADSPFGVESVSEVGEDSIVV